MKKKVVVIDDEEDLCHLIKAFLGELNYDVYLAYNLTSGLSLTHHVNPDVLFVDNNLPDGLGWEKMTYFKENFPHCKINLISANKPGNVETLAESGSVNIIEKPLRLNELKQYL